MLFEILQSSSRQVGSLKGSQIQVSKFNTIVSFYFLVNIDRKVGLVSVLSNAIALGGVSINLDALGYGMITGAVGIGAFIGATVLPKIRQRLSLNAEVAIATLIYGGGMLVAYLRSVPLLLVLSLVVGVAWIALISSFNVAAQVVLPTWFRARGLAAYLIAFLGGMAAGGLIWGAVASRIGTSTAIENVKICFIKMYRPKISINCLFHD